MERIRKIATITQKRLEPTQVNLLIQQVRSWDRDNPTTKTKMKKITKPNFLKDKMMKDEIAKRKSINKKDIKNTN